MDDAYQDRYWQTVESLNDAENALARVVCERDQARAEAALLYSHMRRHDHECCRVLIRMVGTMRAALGVAEKCLVDVDNEKANPEDNATDEDSKTCRVNG